MPRSYTKKEKPYNELMIQQAVEEVEAGNTIRKTAAKYHMSLGFLFSRVKKGTNNEEHPDGRGRSFALDPKLEEKLVKLLKGMESMGLGPRATDFRLLLKDYLDANEINTRFKDNLPGREWLSNFMQRHRLVLKKGGQMQLARKNVTSDPFIVYGFYDLLAKIMNDLGIENRPECIYNTDETGFPIDPKRCTTIGSKGTKTVRLTHGSNRENITVLATCCGNGKALDPLVVFKGKNMQSTWMGDKALPNIQYAVSDSGWMTTAIFEDFFKDFVKKTAGVRPILLVLDGHTSHTSLNTQDLAVRENITILKLPPHCTDLLQPLDVACFSPLKNYYEIELLKQVQETGAREPLRKAGFVNLLSRIWRESLSENNVIAGSRTTGIHPLNLEKYDVSRLDSIKMKTYERWVLQGKPLDTNGDPILEQEHLPETDPVGEQMPPNSPLAIEQPAEVDVDAVPGCSSWANSLDAESCVTQDLTKVSTNLLCQELKCRAPEGMKYCITLEPKETETTLVEVLKSRGRTSTPAPGPRKRLNMKAQVISNKECGATEKYRTERRRKGESSRKGEICTAKNKQEKTTK